PLASDGPSVYDLTLESVNRTVQMEEEITATYNAIPFIELQREEIDRRKNCTTALLAPIRVLPPEMLGEIFLAYITPDDAEDPGRSPLQLCRISSAWRSIAIATPQLWSHLSVPY
ncbi:hypothetical protein GALMADRAFT_42452, partial [Galerina marginata CBS 339.88]